MKSAFSGPLAKQFENFVTLMCTTGGKNTTLFRVIKRLDRFLLHSQPQATSLTKPIVTAWFSTFSHLQTTSQQRYRTATFQFCKYLRRRDPATAMREDFEPLRRSGSFRPYIFSREEIAVLLKAARMLRPLTNDPLRPWSMELVIALLYSSGLRISEVVRLLVGDFETSTGSLIIRETKFSKTRLVPLSASTRRLVELYLKRRCNLGLSCTPDDPLRCCPSNHPPCLGSVQVALTTLIRDCGLKPARGHGPRIHDIRHGFAVQRVLEWYQEGKDVQALLPHLATYMGHRGLDSTQRYLSLTPAVLQEASLRFESFISTAHEMPERGGVQ
jgi:integrase